MNLQEYNKEKMAKMSLIELTKLVMQDEKKPMKFNEVFNKVAELKGLSEEQKSSKISQYYTDLNVDGNFVSNGSNTWGLKRWHRTEEKEEEIEERPLRLVRRKKRVTEDEDSDVDLELSAIDANIDEYNDDLEFDEDEFDLDIDEEFDDFDDREED